MSLTLLTKKSQKDLVRMERKGYGSEKVHSLADKYQHKCLRTKNLQRVNRYSNRGALLRLVAWTLEERE